MQYAAMVFGSSKASSGPARQLDRWETLRNAEEVLGAGETLATDFEQESERGNLLCGVPTAFSCAFSTALNALHATEEWGGV
jgi:hypothetical protein